MALIQLRRGTASEWTSANPVLALGEPGWERDTGRLKIGDGGTAWTSLPYVTAADFLALSDTPNSYAGAAAKAVVVKADATGLMFGTVAAGGYGGAATFVAGEVTVPAPWVKPWSSIVALPQSAPIPSGQLYVDPADIVEGVSFKIKSSDVTDTRGVFWLGVPGVPPPGPALYVSFIVNKHESVDHADLIWVADVDTQYFAAYMYFNTTTSQQTIEFYGWDNWEDYGTPVSLDTDVLLEMKLEYDSTVTPPKWTVTPRVDGNELPPFIDESIGPIVQVSVGAPWTGGATTNHHIDDVKIGTTGWGSSDLLLADFATDIVPPFDSVTGTGAVLDAGRLLCTDVGAAVKAITYPP